MAHKNSPKQRVSPRGELQREKLLAKLRPYLAQIRADLTGDHLDVTVEGIARAIGVSKQTLYSHKVVGLISDVADERRKALGRVQKARPGARQKIAKVTVERDQWKRRYETLLDQHTRLVEHLRSHSTVDVLEILGTPLRKVNRQDPAGRAKEVSRLRVVE